MNLGKIAYMAYREHTKGKSLVTNQPIPQWEGLSLEIQRAWNVAVEAVMVAMRPVRDAARKGFEEIQHGYESVHETDDTPQQ